MAKKTTQAVHVRMPKELHRKIQREADRHGQTINAEILVRLEASFETDKTLDVAKDALVKATNKFEEAAMSFQTVANAAVADMVPDEKERALVSEFLSGMPPGLAVRVIQNFAKMRHKDIEPKDKGND
jgi:Arc-like DNA binding domain